MHPIKQMIERRATGSKEGIWSVCSANRYVIEAAMRRCGAKGLPVLVEATANQVNQDGGYTGMKPADFRRFVKEIATKAGFPEKDIILGGDHLGPLTWAGEDEESAMRKAEVLVASYVEAGYTKIHIDTSMRLGSDDANAPLSPAVVAKRGARLAAVCERTYAALKAREPDAPHPVYVVGSEVPVPGGTKEDEGIVVTTPEDFRETLTLFCEEFEKAGASASDIIAVVVQPGVEFSNDSVHEYDRVAAQVLCAEKQKFPNVVFEGHSTDYQTKYALRQMVEDGIAILKVGPALTFALREGLFALSRIEKEQFAGREAQQAFFPETLDHAMAEKPGNWEKYYHGDAYIQKLQRAYGFSDRCRYYLTDPAVDASMEKLLENLTAEVPAPALVSQYLPEQYRRVREEGLACTAQELLLDKVGTLMDDYVFAVCESGQPGY